MLLATLMVVVAMVPAVERRALMVLAKNLEK
jgi:hypothetical protein